MYFLYFLDTPLLSFNSTKIRFYRKYNASLHKFPKRGKGEAKNIPFLREATQGSPIMKTFYQSMCS